MIATIADDRRRKRGARPRQQPVGERGEGEAEEHEQRVFDAAAGLERRRDEHRHGRPQQRQAADAHRPRTGARRRSAAAAASIKQRPGAEQAGQSAEPAAVDDLQAGFERAQVGAVERAVERDRLAAHRVGNGQVEVAEDRRREIDGGDQPALVGGLRGERVAAAEPGDGHPQQFVAGLVGRSLHDDLERRPRGARRSTRAGQLSPLAPAGRSATTSACVSRRAAMRAGSVAADPSEKAAIRPSRSAAATPSTSSPPAMPA